MSTKTLPTRPVHAIDSQVEEARWLIRDLWGASAVGIIGGAPKSCKSWLALDLAVSVASGTACLGRFEVESQGPALVYLAEDPLVQLRDRVAQLCRHRGIALDTLPLHAITAPSLRLDLESDRRALDQTLSALQPRILVLDPLIRLHRLDENSSADVSGLLGFLRELNRRHHLALVLVHHMAKRSHRDPGQALRGSSDLHAWTDSACYLIRRSDGHLRLSVEHRAAPAPESMLVRLAGGTDEPCRLELGGPDAAPPPLAEAVRAELQSAPESLSRAALRTKLRVNNARLGQALQTLEQRGLALRGPNGWSVPAQAHQLHLPLSR